MNSNVKAFLDMIAFSEGTYNQGDNGYNVIVGSTKSKPSLFDDYSEHPNKLVTLNIKGKEVKSTAAGRYQLLHRYWTAYKAQLALKDFGRDSQDRIAIQQIRECKALPNVEQGRFDVAVQQVARIWASLPGAGYGQHEHKLQALKDHYVKSGGSYV